MSTPTEANLRPRRSSRAKPDVDYDYDKLQRLEYRRAKAEEDLNTRRKRYAKKRRKKSRERKRLAQEQAECTKEAGLQRHTEPAIGLEATSGRCSIM